MLLVGSALKGYAIAASDGRIGTVSDFLFDDRTWKVRWLVVDTGNWLPGRMVLIHPSAIGQADYERRELAVTLTMEKVKGSPDLMQDQPVSQQMEYHLYDYYGWDQYWGGASYFGAPWSSAACPVATRSCCPRGKASIASMRTGSSAGSNRCRSRAVCSAPGTSLPCRSPTRVVAAASPCPI